MPAGGVIQPDGRPPRAKGIGKTARRHDLEAPATPGVGNSDMQHGDRQRLEQAQQVAPRPKKQNAASAPQPAPSRAPQRPAPNVEAPDAIDFIASRGGGTLNPATIGRKVSGQAAAAWQPFMQELARDATASGPLTTKLLAQLSNLRNAPNEAFVEVIDQNAAEDAIRASIE